MNFDNFDNSHNSFLWAEYFIDYLCERWIPWQASTSVLCLHYRPETVHCSTKDAYNSEITFLFIQSLSFWPTDFWFGDETGFLLDIQNSKEQKLNGKKNNIQTNNKLSLNIFMIFKIFAKPHKGIESL